MKVLGLISGGKDSCYSLMYCIAAGHQIVALGHLKPHDSDEMDSFMFQTVGHNMIHLYAQAMDLPLLQVETNGVAVHKDMNYIPHEGDEVEDVYSLLMRAKEELGIEAVSTGAILSNYQRIRVESVCSRLGLVSLAYLWRRDQEELLREMVDCGVTAILVKTAALGLKPELHLGKDISELLPLLLAMKDKYGLNVCGEGGEYETFTLDCPIFKLRIVVDEYEQALHSNDEFAPVSYIKFKSAHLESKPQARSQTQLEMVSSVPLKSQCDFLSDVLSASTRFGHEAIPARHTFQEPEMCVIDDDYWPAPQVSFQSDEWCHVSGIIGKDSDISKSMKMALDKMKDILEQYKLSVSDVVIVNLYLSDMAYYDLLNTTYKTYFKVNPPCRVCVATHLPPNIHVLMNVEACRNASQSDSLQILHVQSISWWAPANIGPYSQAVKNQNYIYVAGQIGLIPGTMKLIEGAFAQSMLALRHAKSIVQALDSSVCLQHVHHAICYVANVDTIAVAKEAWRRSRTDNTQEDQGNCHLVTYVIVKDLPRYALVEWQVMMSIDIKGQCRDCHTSVISGLQVHHHKSANLATVASLKTDDRVNPNDLVEIFSILKNESPFSYSSLHYVVMYKVTRTTATAVQKGWESSVLNSLETAHLSIIPVLGFEKPETCLVITVK